jgi:hypothetical protein
MRNAVELQVESTKSIIYDIDFIQDIYSARSARDEKAKSVHNFEALRPFNKKYFCPEIRVIKALGEGSVVRIKDAGKCI